MAQAGARRAMTTRASLWRLRLPPTSSPSCPGLTRASIGAHDERSSHGTMDARVKPAHDGLCDVMSVRPDLIGGSSRATTSAALLGAVAVLVFLARAAGAG